MAQYVVYNCWEPVQGILSELLFTRLGHGYIFNGGGFSHYPAGLSNDSVMTKFPDLSRWKMLERYATEYSPFGQNLKWQVTIVKAQEEVIRSASAEKKRKAEDGLEEVMAVRPSSRPRRQRETSGRLGDSPTVRRRINLKRQVAIVKAQEEVIKPASAEKTRKAEDSLEEVMAVQWQAEQERRKKFARTKSGKDREKECQEAVFRVRLTDVEHDVVPFDSRILMFLASHRPDSILRMIDKIYAKGK
ncbi:hypothetical protein EG327_011412 [Venturia inaequalis]|uniref:Uncharacterized protein n=2 Tax=Venturia inaequalis TaxID=5025 RepID=A0A8H3VSN9_VENIN|nr:hypothetical protein EG327_011412 [Venturia inaequalis]